MRLLAVFASLFAFVGFAVAVEKFESKTGNYSVNFPGEAKTGVKKVGTAELNVASYQSDNNGMLVIHTDVNSKDLKEVALSKLLEGGEQSFAENMKADSYDSKELNLKSGERKYLAREFYIKKGKGFFRVRLFAIENRLYQMVVFGDEKYVDGKESEEFFKSFQLVKATVKD